MWGVGILIRDSLKCETRLRFQILRSANLRQQVQERTERHGHMLDLVISRDDDNLVKGVSVSSMLSDHFLININVSLLWIRTSLCVQGQ